MSERTTNPASDLRKRISDALESAASITDRTAADSAGSGTCPHEMEI